MEKITDHISGLRRSATLAVMTVGLVVFGGIAANAAGEDGAVEAKFSDLTSTITGVYVPAVVTLALAGVAVFMGIRWVKKGASKA